MAILTNNIEELKDNTKCVKGNINLISNCIKHLNKRSLYKMSTFQPIPIQEYRFYIREQISFIYARPYPIMPFVKAEVSFIMN